MITSRKIPIITAAFVCVCLLACGLIVYGANTFDTARAAEYENRLFGDKIITLEIKADAADWQGLLDNAQAKEWIKADLIINGERFSDVGVRTKGNSSLSQISGASGRYSLQFKFNKYVKGQTYYGLDAFCVNNLTGDATYMKDYLCYEIMDYIGVAAPLTNFADISVNGESYGFFVALERYDKAFLDRVYGTSAGQLYSVKIGMGMRGNFEELWQDVQDATPVRRQAGAADRGGAVGFGGFGGSGGGSLVYVDDDIGSYSAIFDNAVFSSTSDKDKKRVVEAIKNLNDGTDLEKYFDVDAILRYLAAHTVVVNLDSYSSNMQQNYYIYERDGKLTVLPWDYGLAFGGFQSGSASSVVNFPIDTPVSGVSMADRPLIDELLAVDEYRERYHDYLRQIAEGYFASGLFENAILALDEKIGGYVKNDATAFFTYEQYEASLPQLIELGRLRAQSVIGQLDGEIPSTSSGQSADGSKLVDASGVNLSAFGSMGGMGQGGWQGGEQGGRQDWQGNVQPGGAERQPGGRNGERQNSNIPGGAFEMDIMQQAMQIIAQAGGELTEEVKQALLELGLTEDEIAMFSEMQNVFPGGGQNAMPGGANAFPQGMNGPAAGGSGASGGEYAAAVIALLAILIGVTAFVAKPRKNVV